MEQEKEEERVPEVEEEAAPLKYSRQDQESNPWLLRTLSSPPNQSTQGFYPCAEFSVMQKLMTPCHTLPFPSFMLMSENYYKPSWSLNTHRRLKNVIIVMEWIPDWGVYTLPPHRAPDTTTTTTATITTTTRATSTTTPPSSSCESQPTHLDGEERRNLISRSRPSVSSQHVAGVAPAGREGEGDLRESTRGEDSERHARANAAEKRVSRLSSSSFNLSKYYRPTNLREESGDENDLKRRQRIAEVFDCFDVEKKGWIEEGSLADFLKSYFLHLGTPEEEQVFTYLLIRSIRRRRRRRKEDLSNADDLASFPRTYPSCPDAGVSPHVTDKEPSFSSSSSSLFSSAADRLSTAFSSSGTSGTQRASCCPSSASSSSYHISSAPSSSAYLPPPAVCFFSRHRQSPITSF